MSNEPYARIGTKVGRPLPDQAPWHAPDVAALRDRLDAALRARRAAA